MLGHLFPRYAKRRDAARAHANAVQALRTAQQRKDTRSQRTAYEAARNALNERLRAGA